MVISPPDMREASDDIDDSNDDRILKYWKRMMEQYGDSDKYEEAMKINFKMVK